MFIELSHLWIVILNVVLIPVIHLSLSWLFVQMPLRWFNPRSIFFSKKPGEHRGRIYETAFQIRKWKNAVPDAGGWFSNGFPKNLVSKEPAFIREFIAETCRSEACHQAQLFALLIPLLWNPWPASLVIVIYATVSNFPFIIIQRHTRFRLEATFLDGPDR